GWTKRGAPPGAHIKRSSPRLEAALLALSGRRLRGGLALPIRLAVRGVVVLGRGGDARERLPALGAAYGLVGRLRGRGRVVARLVANLVVARRWLIRRVRPVAGRWVRCLALTPAALGLGLGRWRDGRGRASWPTRL